MMIAGRKIFGNAPISGVRREADMLRADSARCTSAKFVVQSPNPSTKPRPKTTPTQSDISGLVT